MKISTSVMSRKAAAWVLVGGIALFGFGSSAMAQGQGPFGGDANCNRITPGTTSNCTLQAASGNRTFVLDVPRSVDPQKVAGVIVDLHGLGGNARAERATSSFLQAATARGMVIAFGQGLNNSWNTQGRCCEPSNGRNVDDVAFLKDLGRKLQQLTNVTRDQTIVTGLSNGGFMTDTLACEGADVFSAAIAVSGGLAGGAGGGDAAAIKRDCTPASPIDFLQWHTPQDAVVPFNTGILNSLGAVESRQVAAEIQGCDAQIMNQPTVGNVTCGINPNCDGNVLSGLCIVQNGNHVLAPTVRGTTLAGESFKVINQSRAARGQRDMLPEAAATVPMTPAGPTAPTVPLN